MIQLIVRHARTVARDEKRARALAEYPIRHRHDGCVNHPGVRRDQILQFFRADLLPASTFLVECDAGTWIRAGFSTMNDEESRAYCARIFTGDLQGHQLMSNKSTWTSFTVSSNARWSHRNVVLVGDALRSVHFSIGSGTRLALEDAIALHCAIQSTSTICQALDAFETARRPIVDKIIAAEVVRRRSGLNLRVAFHRRSRSRSQP